MHGAVHRLVRKNGVEYTIRNAPDTSGDREAPNYVDDGTLVGVLEQRRMPTVETLSSGEEVKSNLELRAVYDSSQTTIVDAGESDYPTKLVHPDGPRYRVLVRHTEDGGVTVLTLERE